MFDWITSVIDAIGSIGIAVLMFAENLFPPIPSELIMPLAGFTAAAGARNIVVVIAAGTVGSLAGALLWYWIGVKLGAERLRALSERHGRWLTIGPDDFDRASAWFQRHGAMAVLIGRLIPTVRTFISVPAGVAGMPLGRFIFYSTVGTVVWTALLALAGFWLQANYAAVQTWLNPVSTGVVAILLAIYLWRVVTFKPREA